MAQPLPNQSLTLCPSAQPSMRNSAVFGIVTGTVEQPEVNYLAEPQPVSEELLTLSQPVAPTEVFRFAAACANTGCQHFNGSQCRLAERIVQNLPPVTENLPLCPIRANCRWWQQEGKAACLRCPQIATEVFSPSEQLYQAMTPTVYAQ